jgi:hypothetical protein
MEVAHVPKTQEIEQKAHRRVQHSQQAEEETRCAGTPTA